MNFNILLLFFKNTKSINHLVPADARRVSRLAVEEEANRPSFDLKDKRDFSGCPRQEGGYSGSSRWLIRLKQVAHLDRQPVPGGGESWDGEDCQRG